MAQPATDSARLDEGKKAEAGEAGAVQNTSPLQSRPGEILLVAGEQLSVTTRAASKVEDADVTAAVAWTQHRLVFNSAPLREVVNEFNRYNSRQIVLDAPELESFGVVGVFSSTDPSSLLRFLSTQQGIAVEESGGEIRITRR